MGKRKPRTYCFCRKPAGKRYMIFCDFCKDWFHGDCIGESEEDAEFLPKKWSCPKCSKNTGRQLNNRSSLSKRGDLINVKSFKKYLKEEYELQFSGLKRYLEQYLSGPLLTALKDCITEKDQQTAKLRFSEDLVSEQKQVIDAQAQEISKLMETVDNLQGENTKNQDHCDLLEKTNSQLLQSKGEEISKLMKTVDNLESENTKYQNNSNLLENTNSQLLQQLQQLQEMRSNQNEEFSKLAKKLAGSEAEIISLKANLESTKASSEKLCACRSRTANQLDAAACNSEMNGGNLLTNILLLDPIVQNYGSLTADIPHVTRAPDCEPMAQSKKKYRSLSLTKKK